MKQIIILLFHDDISNHGTRALHPNI